MTTAPRKNLDPKDMEILRLRRENAKLRARLEALALQYDDVREQGKITTIYDNEKGVCIHVPDDKWYESVDEDNMATGCENSDD